MGFSRGPETDSRSDDTLGWEFLKDFSLSPPLPRHAVKGCWFSRMPRDTHMEMGVDVVAVPQTLLLRVQHFSKGNIPRLSKDFV